MSILFRLACLLILACTGTASLSQTNVKRKIVDAVTNEPIRGATINCEDAGCRCGCTTNAAGEFDLSCSGCSQHTVSFIGYQSQIISTNENLVLLTPVSSLMNEVVVSANRGERMKRSQAPVAISSISHKTIQETKSTTIDQLLNKVSGVYMVNLGNEQHSMSIRQPMTTKSLFLYLEDGIPLRTSGLFNHNALLEMNMASVKTIEVIKGPSSSLYGSEAIGGVVNFITLQTPAIPLMKISINANDIGYRRGDLQAGFTKGNWGFMLSGYHAERKNGFIDYSDFNKSSFSFRTDIKLGSKTNLSTSASWMNYESDMAGSIDSTKFSQRKFTSIHTFTWRNTRVIRLRSTLDHKWNERSKTTVSLAYRDNTMSQNPAYSIKNDRRKLSNGSWTGNKELAHGEINENSFNSYVLIAQQKQNINWKNAVLMAGASVDLSPTKYRADYIRIKVDTLSGKYISYEEKDSVLTWYSNGINNYAGFINFEFTPLNRIRFVSSLRYDLYSYDLDNHLSASAFSGSADTINYFSALSPKLGFTYNFSARTGFYANYSQGFVPPQVTEMYRGVKVPDLHPSNFYNYELGGWMEIIKNKLTADISIYILEGKNEIVSMRMEDGTTENRNTGKTRHKGIEAGINATPSNELSIRASAAYSQHHFVEFVEKGTSYNGKEMNGAPHWMHNAEIWYRPAFAKGLRMGLEWQKISKYFMDPGNTVTYKGYNVLLFRTAMQWKNAEIWLNILNLTDNYYANMASKSSYGYNYTPAEPRNFNLGISFDLAKILNKDHASH